MIEERERVMYSDRGSTRLYVDLPGVRFDLTEEAGTIAFAAWYSSADSMLQGIAISQLIGLIHRLNKK